MISIKQKNTLTRFICFSTLVFAVSANSALIKNIEKNDSFSKTTTTSTSTFLENIPIASLLVSIPEFTMQGDAFAYEEGRDFVNPLAPKIIELGTLTTTYGPVTETNDTGLISQTYGNNGAFTDTARAQTSFTGTPIGPQIGVGPVTTSALDGIIGTLGITLDVTQQGNLENVISTAKAIVDDPFDYIGLSDQETIWLNPSLGAGTSFTYDTGGVTSADMLSIYRGSITTSVGTESLFNLNIGIGNSAGFTPDIVVDFDSNPLFALDNDAIALSILDAFSFDSVTKTFLLEQNLDLFTLPINFSTLGDVLENPFSISLVSEADTGGDPYQLVSDIQQRYLYDGSGLQRILNNTGSGPVQPNPVPETSSFLLIFTSIILLGFVRIRRRWLASNSLDGYLMKKSAYFTFKQPIQV